MKCNASKHFRSHIEWGLRLISFTVSEPCCNHRGQLILLLVIATGCNWAHIRTQKWKGVLSNTDRIDRYQRNNVDISAVNKATSHNIRADAPCATTWNYCVKYSRPTVHFCRVDSISATTDICVDLFSAIVSLVVQIEKRIFCAP